VSFINYPFDSFTHEPPALEDLTTMFQTLLTSCETYEPEILNMIKFVLGRCLSIVSSMFYKVKEENHHSYSDALLSVAGIVDYYEK